jgi:3-methyl-2-oxobutanoate hydroxymethyltransferase
VPTISYGAGPHCDGQGMVSADMFGLFEGFKPKFAKRYLELGAQIQKTFETYCEEVRAGRFPADEHTYHIDPAELAKLRK